MSITIRFFAALAAVHYSARATDLAWNGYVDTDSPFYGQPAFTSYFVPNGSVSFDDADPSIDYAPVNAWSRQTDSDCVQRTVHTSTATVASATFKFTGTGIEWFGSASPKHGFVDVHLDGSPVRRIDGYSPVWRKQQRLYASGRLEPGQHTLQIINSGKKRAVSKGTWFDVDAFVVDVSYSSPSDPRARVATSNHEDWTLIQRGESGVHAMQLAVVSERHVIIVDKVEHNPLSIDGHPAWAALFNLKYYTVSPIEIRSNSFCAGGSFLSNGTLVNVGGNPVVVDKTGPADFGDTNGLQAIRLFHPCPADDVSHCGLQEYPPTLRLASLRWYNTVVRIQDGSVIIIGGSSRGGWMNNITSNNPTFEFYPPKNLHGYVGLPIPSPFLHETLNSNLFPISFLLPDGRLFVAANNDAMIYNWKTNAEERLPSLPNGVRVTYPMTGTGLLLPLRPELNYAPTILICGGSTLDDTRPGYEMSSQDPASDQCSTILLTPEGIREGWQTERMPQARIMPDAVLLPTGEVLLINGGQTGIAGYGNVRDQVGFSNADNPALTPIIYNHNAPLGQRFTSNGLPESRIPRLYHSVATLVPDGRVMIAGSNPNLDISKDKYATEYRVEWLSPPWLQTQGEEGEGTSVRPSYVGVPSKIVYGSSFTLEVDLGGSHSANIQVSLMDLGFVTHAVHMNSRLVVLEAILSEDGLKLEIHGPPSETIYPPGPAFIYLVVDGKWSTAVKVMVGESWNPPEDPTATQNLLNMTSPPSRPSDDEGSVNEEIE